MLHITDLFTRASESVSLDEAKAVLKSILDGQLDDPVFSAFVTTQAETIRQALLVRCKQIHDRGFAKKTKTTWRAAKDTGSFEAFTCFINHTGERYYIGLDCYQLKTVFQLQETTTSIYYGGSYFLDFRLGGQESIDATYQKYCETQDPRIRQELFRGLQWLCVNILFWEQREQPILPEEIPSLLPLVHELW